MGNMSKWSKTVSAKEEAAVRKAMEEQSKNQKRFKDVPSGIYEVVVDKMEVHDFQYGSQINIVFKITSGEFQNQRIFYNGSFEEKFTCGINQTAVLIKDMIDDDSISKEQIAVILGHGREEAEDFLADAAEMCEDLAYDLDYDVQLSNKTNPYTGKPYENKYYTINAVYDN